jgi:peptidyl-prolyl cis-trans isomerase-like 4
VTEGLDVLEKLNHLNILDKKNRPYFNIRIKHTLVLDDPFDDPKGFEEKFGAIESPKELT